MSYNAKNLLALSAFIYKSLKHQNKSLPSTIPSVSWEVIGIRIT